MPRRSNVPSYRLHKQSGQAVVTLRDALSGRRHDVLLGPHGSPASRAEYARVVGEWEACGRRLAAPSADASDVTVNELILAFLTYADDHYSEEGREVVQFKLSLRPLRELYGPTPACRFGPKAVKAVRQAMIDSGLCRNVVNRRVGRIKTLFKWATEEELIPGDVYGALRAVRGVAPNAPGVRQTAPVAPAFWEDVLPALPFCPPPVAAMLELQWLAGMRSGEVRRVRTMDLDRGDPAAWTYRPGSDAGPHGAHKNAWRGQDRVVSLGPQVRRGPDALVAARRPGGLPIQPGPRRGGAERDARRAARRSPTTPSQRRRKAKKRRRPPGRLYTTDGYCAGRGPGVQEGRLGLPRLPAPARPQDGRAAGRRQRRRPRRPRAEVHRQHHALRRPRRGDGEGRDGKDGVSGGGSFTAGLECDGGGG